MEILQLLLDDKGGGGVGEGTGGAGGVALLGKSCHSIYKTEEVR